MWTLAPHNILAQLVLNGILVAVTGETADVRACVSNLRAAYAEEFSMLMYVCTTCPNRHHCTTWDRMLLHCVVCTSFQHAYLDIFLISRAP